MKLTVPALRPPEPDVERLASAEGTSHLLDEIDRLLADNASALNCGPARAGGGPGRPGRHFSPAA
jgi:hypothetical protein